MATREDPPVFAPRLVMRRVVSDFDCMPTGHGSCLEDGTSIAISQRDRRFQMPRTMRAAVIRAFGQPLTIEEVPIPTPGPGEVLVKSWRAASVTRTSTQRTATGP